ncbi:MAG: NADH-quinone oxidoreductase subunit NuoE [Candidatus Bathyarchaeia archaeon]
MLNMFNQNYPQKKKERKSQFVGLRIGEKERERLFKLKEATGLSKTQLLLKGLELLGEYYSLDLDQPPLSIELKRLEMEALRYAEAIKQIRQRGQAIKLIVQELRDVDAIVDKHKSDRSRLIQILLDVQKKYGWLPKLALIWISERLNVSMAQIYSIATFYKAFSLIPRGRHTIRVCMGTSCKVRGAPELLNNLQRILGIEPGQTTPDGKFTLTTVNCLGCCAISPVLTIDGEYYGHLKLTDVKKILAKYN